MRVAVVDDFEPDRRKIEETILRFCEERQVSEPQLFCYASGEEFLGALEPKLFDLVLMDCCMGGMDGLETANGLRKVDEDAVLVFITSCRDYAVGGYLVSASGYLVKPYTYEVFVGALDKALAKVAKKQDTIIVADGNEKREILADDIVYCDIAGHYVQIHLTASRLLRVRMSFASFLLLLAPYPQFLVCYRGCMINMAHTCKAEEMNFLMDTGERVPFRKKEHSKLVRKYSEYLFGQARVGRSGKV